MKKETFRKKAFQKKLLGWYQKNRRPLPWRDNIEAWPVWVSEVMLQQTQADTVIPYFQSFIKRFPTPAHLARARLQTVLKVWEGLGYYARARNLHRAAKHVHETYHGKVPLNADAFRKLPGVGPYIGAAVLSIAGGHRAAVVDGNVKRVLSRLFLLEAFANDGKHLDEFQRRAQALIPLKTPGDYNQAVMELGALICRPRRPNCAACPVNSHCRAYQGRKQDEYPKKRAKKKTPLFHIAAACILKKGRVFIARRHTSGMLGGMWEFPGGKRCPGETAEAACAREIKEELNIRIDVGPLIARVNHAYTHFKISMDIFKCRHLSGTIHLNAHSAGKWMAFADLRKYPMPMADIKALPDIEAALFNKK